MATSIAVDGLKLKFMAKPPMSPKDSPPARVFTSPKNEKILLPLVEEWEKRGIVTKDPALIPATVHFSLLFPVDKKDGAFRPILDLSFLNTFILTPGLRMETVSHIVACIHEQRWATSLDITDAFLSVWMHPIFQRYLCFVLGGTVYMFRRLPFGLTTAPWAFSRLMRPIKHCLRGRRVHVNSFIDDFIILALSKAQGSLHTLWTENLLRWLGFNINESKSVGTPLQVTEYLGVQLNLRTLTLALPLEKVNLILARTSQVSSSPSTTRRQLESLVGLLNFAAPLLPLGRLYLAPIIIWMNSHTVPLTRDQSTPVDASLRTALKPFLNRIYLVDHVSCHPPSPSLDLQTDASDYGWSGVIDGHRVRGYWTPLESSAHINVREMKGLFNALKFFHPCLEGKCIRIHTDSMVVLFCLKRQSSLHSPLPHPWSAQCTCRPRVSSPSSFHRVDVGPRVIRVHLPRVLFHSPGGPFCHTGYMQVRLLCLSVSGSRSFPSGCLGSFLQLESVPSYLCFSSSKSYAFNYPQDPGFQGSNASDCSSEIDTLLDSLFTAEGSFLEGPSGGLLSLSDGSGRLHNHGIVDPIPSVCVPSSSCPLNSQEQVNVDSQVTGSDKEVAFSSSSHVSKKKVPAVSSPAGPSNTRPVRSRDFSGQFPDPCYVAFPPLSRLSVWQNDLEKLGFSPQAINLAIKSQKPGTSRQYQSGWGLLVKYIVEHGIRHEDITASLLGNLVVSQFVEKNRATTTCLNYLYAWRKPVKILFGFDILSNENVVAIISGMKQDRPIKRGMVVFPKWRLQWLLDHLNSEIFEPLDQQSSRIICVKFMILTLLYTGRRLGEISALTKDVTYHPDGSISFK